MSQVSRTPRVLAIDPTSKGLAFAVFEDPELLLDWGSSEVQPKNKNALCLERVGHLIRFYAPEVLVIEAWDGRGSYRRRRVRSLIRSIDTLARRRGLRCRAFSRAQVRKAFGELPRQTRHPIATEIAMRFPELGRDLPGVRRFWESEDERMSIFDAASLAVTYYRSRSRCTGERVARPTRLLPSSSGSPGPQERTGTTFLS